MSASSTGEEVPSSDDHASALKSSWCPEVAIRSDSPVTDPRSKPCCCRENKRQSSSIADLRVLDARLADALAAGINNVCTERSLDFSAVFSRRLALSWSDSSALVCSRPSMYSFRFFRESFAEYLFFTCRRRRLSSRSEALERGPFFGTVMPSASINPRSSSVRISKNDPERTAAAAAEFAEGVAPTAAAAGLRLAGLGELARRPRVPLSRFGFRAGLGLVTCGSTVSGTIGVADESSPRGDGFTSMTSMPVSSTSSPISSESKEVSEIGEAESSRRFSSSTEPADHSGDHSFNQFGSITVSSAGKSVISPSSKKDMSWLIKK
eukprot:m.133542 g.133542  ORF g.133542 m.133542 type:complete len:323 (-) comp13839_c0_seq1:368-1336(-)